jgi:hypothetical protein
MALFQASEVGSEWLTSPVVVVVTFSPITGDVGGREFTSVEKIAVVIGVVVETVEANESREEPEEVIGIDSAGVLVVVEEGG